MTISSHAISHSLPHSAEKLFHFSKSLHEQLNHWQDQMDARFNLIEKNLNQHLMQWKNNTENFDQWTKNISIDAGMQVIHKMQQGNKEQIEFLNATFREIKNATHQIQDQFQQTSHLFTKEFSKAFSKINNSFLETLIEDSQKQIESTVKIAKKSLIRSSRMFYWKTFLLCAALASFIVILMSFYMHH